jgi:hypothetical protein
MILLTDVRSFSSWFWRGWPTLKQNIVSVFQIIFSFHSRPPFSRLETYAFDTSLLNKLTMIHAVFSCGLVNDTVRIRVVSCDCAVDEWRIGKDLEGSGRVLIVVLSRNLFRGSEENHEKRLVRIASVREAIKIRHCPNATIEYYRYLMSFAFRYELLTVTMLWVLR